MSRLVIKSLLKHPIAYHKCFADLMRSASGGLFLSQVYYWWSIKNSEWNYKFNNDFMVEIGLSEWELRKAKERAIELGIIEIRLSKIGKQANVPFYRINEDVLFELLEQQSHNEEKNSSSIPHDNSTIGDVNSSIPSCEIHNIMLRNPPYPLEYSSQPIYTETTTKNTAKITTKNTTNKKIVKKEILQNNCELELMPESEEQNIFCDNPDRVDKKNDVLFDDNGFNETDKVAINNWLNYHRELKKPYKTKSGLTALRNKMLELAKNGLLIEAVNHSMAMGYTGLFPPNTKRYMPPNNNSPSLSSVIKNCNSQDFSSEEF